MYIRWKLQYNRWKLYYNRLKLYYNRCSEIQIRFKTY
jgi:hypothetical protein